MGLYLCVFDDNQELEGVEIGSYSDFEFFRQTVTDLLEEGCPGSKYPVLICHADSDGEWTTIECVTLKQELSDISDGLKKFPAIQFRSEWQQKLGKLLSLKSSNLYDCFIDVDGESLLERLIQLCDLALESGKPILFQ